MALGVNDAPRVTVRLAAPLRQRAGGRAALPVAGRTVGEVLAALVAEHPGLRPRLRSPTGGLRPHILVFVNAQDVRAREGEDTPLSPGDDVFILPAVEGG
jgi:molybdopterin converting factor small subunit